MQFMLTNGLPSIQTVLKSLLTTNQLSADRAKKLNDVKNHLIRGCHHCSIETVDDSLMLIE